MNLLEQIRSDRLEKKKKRPFIPALFTRVCWIVRSFGLNDSFLFEIGNFREQSIRERMAFPIVKVKKRFEPPPFVLAAENDYYLSKKIIARVESPYIEFAHSPDEIILANPLFRHNPSVARERLEHYHFETLLMYELARAEVRILSNKIGSLERTVAELTEGNNQSLGSAASWRDASYMLEQPLDGRSQLNLLRERLKKLEKFILKVGRSDLQERKG